MFIDVLLLLASGLVAAGLAPIAAACLQRNDVPRPDSFFLMLGFSGSVMIGALLKAGMWVTGFFHSASATAQFGAFEYHLITNTLVTAAALWLVEPEPPHAPRQHTSSSLTASLLAYCWTTLKPERRRPQAASTLSIGDNQ